MRFRPRFWPSLIALVMMAILLGLGTWQLQRKVWKENLLATIAARMDAPPVDLPSTLGDPQDWSFRRVHLTGHFADDKAIRLYGRTYEGKAGVHLLVPLIRDNGPAVLVDRGFVPFESGDTLAPIAPSPDEIDGVVRPPEAAGRFVPSDKPDRNIWYGVDIPAMSRVVGRDLAPVYVAARPSGTPGWPAGPGGREALGIRNEHLNYAIFWYSMAAALAVIYGLSSRTRTL